MNKNAVRTLKTIMSIIIGVVGLVTFIFAILRLADVNDSNPAVVLRIMGGIALTMTGVAFLMLSLFKNSDKEITTYRDLLSAALFLGLGIFCFIEKEADAVIQMAVMVVIPLIVICFGAGLFIKSVINIVRKLPVKKILLPLLTSAILIAVGVIFVIYRDNQKLEAVVWLVVGLGMLTASIVDVVMSLKNKSDKTSIEADKE